MKVSKNCYRGEVIKNPSTILTLASNKQSIYTENWGVKPAAILLSMHFRIIMELINEERLFRIINTERNEQ